MTIKNWTKSLPIFSMVAAAMLTSCFGGKSQHDGQHSNVTGWAYNDPAWGGYEYTAGYEQPTGPGLVFIEGGKFIMGRTEEDPMLRQNASPRSVTVASFYMDECEVSNANYREYLFWMQRIFGEENKRVIEDAKPDTLVWRRPLAYNEPYVESYFRSPAYADYPVVGVSWEQANKFCYWRSNRVNEMLLIEAGRIDNTIETQAGQENFDTDAFLYGMTSVQDLDPDGENGPISDIILPKYMLPTEAQWEYAAIGLVENTNDELVSNRKIYPWNSHIVRNPDDAVRGQMMANFVRGNGDYMGTAGNLNDHADLTAPVRSYWPNGYGLYCMAGNVNEWVADVYRPLSFTMVEEFNPFRGNTFLNTAVDETGAPLERDSLGQLKKELAKVEPNRKNYRRADLINYLDGDERSGITASPDDADMKGTTTSMYGKVIGENEYSQIGTQLGHIVSDRTRVYKGGGWRDRAYWLSPGARRWLDQAESRDDIGFRCAMVRVGSPVQGKGK